MAWTYLVVSEGSQVPSVVSSILLPTVSKTDMLKQFSCQEWEMDQSTKHRSGMMSELCKAQCLICPLTSSPLAFPARTSVVRDQVVRAWMATEAGFSLKCADWSGRSSPLSCSWKTSRPLELKVFQESSMNLQISGMTVGGLVYQPLRLVPTILDKGGSCWANRWPTPRASDPSHSDCPSERRRDRPSLDARVGMTQRPIWEKTTLRVNPIWLEWLMGFPLGHTELSGWAMLWFLGKPGPLS